MDRSFCRGLSLILLVLAGSTVPVLGGSGRQQSYLRQFRGKVRVWRCDWALDDNATSMPSSISIVITEHHWANEGYERLTTKWGVPYRHNLAPDLSYHRSTSDSTVQASGNNHGARAFISSPPDNYSGKDALVEMFDEPIAAFAEQKLVEAITNMAWKRLPRGSMPLLHYAQKKTLQVLPSRDVYGAYLSGETSDSQSLHTHIRAQALYVPLALSSAIEPSLVAEPKDSVAPEILASLDGTVMKTPDIHTGLENKSNCSYRVLQWQQLLLTHAESLRIWCRLPRLVSWEEITIWPRSLRPRSHRMAILIIEIIPDDTQALFSDWKNLLPRMRLADFRTGRAWVNHVEEPECRSSLFIKQISADDSEFRRLIGLNLRAVYPDALEPVAGLVQRETDHDRDIGTMNLGSPIRAIGSLPPGKVDTVSADASGRRAAGVDRIKELPDILELVNRLRAATMQAQQASTDQVRPRQGNKAVPEGEHVTAVRKLATFLFAAAAVGIGALLYFLSSRVAIRRGETHD